MPKKSGKDLSVLILSAGEGRRMKSHGPRSLLEVSPGRTLINHQISTLLNEYPKSEIIGVLGFQSEKIIKHIRNDIKIVENELHAEHGILRSIAMGLRVASHKNILVVYGDIFFNKHTVNRIINGSSVAVIDSTNQMENDNVGILHDNMHITRFCYGTPLKWGQIIYLTGTEEALFRSIVYKKEKKKLNTIEVLNEVIDNGGKIKFAEPECMQILELETQKDINKVKLIND